MPASYPSPVELRSEQVQEILARTPSWLVRWGSLTILGILLGSLGFAWFIRYPDIVAGSAVLTTTHEPAYVYSRVAGNIRQLSVQENEQVREGQLLAEVASTVKKEQITDLQQHLTAVQTFLRQPAAQHAPELPVASFGEVQSAYNKLLENCRDLNQLYSPYYNEAVRRLVDNLAYYTQLTRIYKQKEYISQQELVAAEQQYRANEQLYQNKAIARLDLLEKETIYNQKRRDVEDTRQALVQNQLLLAEQRKRLDDLRFTQSEAERKLRASILDEAQSLAAYIQTWHQNNAIIAPAAGRVVFLEKFSEGFYAHTDKPLLAIVPASEQIIAKVKLPAARYGKVAPGQSVRIALDNYPFQEYGFLFGKVDQKAYLPNGKTYELIVELPNPTTTSYGRKIEYKPNMPATAEVVVENQRLLEKLLYSIRQLLRR